MPLVEKRHERAAGRALRLLGDADAPGSKALVAKALAEAELAPLRGSKRSVLDPRQRIGAINFVRNELMALKRSGRPWSTLHIDYALKLLLTIANRERKELERAP